MSSLQSLLCDQDRKNTGGIPSKKVARLFQNAGFSLSVADIDVLTERFSCKRGVTSHLALLRFVCRETISIEKLLWKLHCILVTAKRNGVDVVSIMKDLEGDSDEGKVSVQLVKKVLLRIVVPLTAEETWRWLKYIGSAGGVVDLNNVISSIEELQSEEFEINEKIEEERERAAEDRKVQLEAEEKEGIAREHTEIEEEKDKEDQDAAESKVEPKRGFFSRNRGAKFSTDQKQDESVEVEEKLDEIAHDLRSKLKKLDVHNADVSLFTDSDGKSSDTECSRLTFLEVLYQLETKAALDSDSSSQILSPMEVELLCSAFETDNSTIGFKKVVEFALDRRFQIIQLDQMYLAFRKISGVQKADWLERVIKLSEQDGAISREQVNRFSQQYELEWEESTVDWICRNFVKRQLQSDRFKQSIDLVSLIKCCYYDLDEQEAILQCAIKKIKQSCIVYYLNDVNIGRVFERQLESQKEHHGSSSEKLLSISIEHFQVELDRLEVQIPLTWVEWCCFFNDLLIDSSNSENHKQLDLLRLVEHLQIREPVDAPDTALLESAISRFSSLFSAITKRNAIKIFMRKDHDRDEKLKFSELHAVIWEIIQKRHGKVGWSVETMEKIPCVTEWNHIMQLLDPTVSGKNKNKLLLLLLLL